MTSEKSVDLHRHIITSVELKKALPGQVEGVIHQLGSVDHWDDLILKQKGYVR